MEKRRSRRDNPNAAPPAPQVAVQNCTFTTNSSSVAADKLADAIAANARAAEALAKSIAPPLAALIIGNPPKEQT